MPLPEGTLRNELHCSNRRCISNMENVDTLFRPCDDGVAEYRCVYCESKPK